MVSTFRSRAEWPQKNWAASEGKFPADLFAVSLDVLEKGGNEGMDFDDLVAVKHQHPRRLTHLIHGKEVQRFFLMKWDKNNDSFPLGAC